MLGSGFRLYLSYTDVTTPHVISSLVKADGTAATSGGITINDLIAGAAGPPVIPADSLKLADEIKDVTESGNPNTINTTTRRTGRLGVQANEITTVNRDLTVQFVYEPRVDFATPAPGYEILDLLEFLDETSTPVYAIDLDKAISTDGSKGGGANYTVSLSQPREVEGQVVYEATFAVKGFYQRVTHNGTLYVAKQDP